MSTDAKLGLVFGMALLIAIAVIFFQSSVPESGQGAPAQQAQR